MSCKWVKSCSAVQVGIILMLPTKVVGLAYFIPISDKDTKRLRYYSPEMDSFMKDSIRNMSYNDDSTLNRAFLSLASYLLSSIFDASIVKRSYLK
jgi:hypothetical protein